MMKRILCAILLLVVFSVQAAQTALVIHGNSAPIKAALTAKPIKPSAGDPPPPETLFPLQTDDNELYRDHDDNQDITSVDPFTGRVFLQIPLIHVPGNNGLDLKINLNWHGMGRPYENPLMQTWAGENNPSVFTGVVGVWSGSQSNDPNWITDNFPAFIDPAGQVHMLYPQAANWTAPGATTTFSSKDQWNASLTVETVDPGSCPVSGGLNYSFSGVIQAPNGVQYQIEPRCRVAPVAKITSPQKGTVLTYTNNNLAQVTAIKSNQGFEADFTYNSAAYPGNQDLASIKTSDNRTWTFGYETQSADESSIYTLNTVTLPNGATWNMHFAVKEPAPNTKANLSDDNKLQPEIYLQTVTSPKGLKVAYTYDTTHCGSIASDNVCNYTDRLAYAFVTSRAISGPGIPNATWSYSYAPMANFQYGNTTTVTGPNKKIVYTYNAENDVLVDARPDYGPQPIQAMPTPHTGLLLSKQIYDATGTTLFEETEYTWNDRQISTVGMYNPPSWCVPKYANITGPYQSSSGISAPQLMKKIITRNGAPYITAYSDYDKYGYPATIKSYSTQDAMQINLTYYEDPILWIFKPASEIIFHSGRQENSTSREFDAYGNIITENLNGAATNYTYDPLGNLTRSTDALGHITLFSNYMAGLPQQITDALGQVSKMSVANNGTITSKTDKNGYTTSYTYDPLYRVSSVTPPIHQPISITWNDSQSGSSATMVRGQHKIVNNFTAYGDTLSTTESGGAYTRNVFRSYDAERRPTFVSYPVAGSTPGAGIATTYDPLDRVLSVTEAGSYTASNQYLDATNTIIKTDPNKNTVTLQYRSFGEPDDKQLMSIQQNADGMPITTAFIRNYLGQVLQVTQGKYTRQYLYDDRHYLIIESNPETGTTYYTRDLLGNILYKKVGVNNSAIRYRYDALNRLAITNYQNADNQTMASARMYDGDDRLLAISDTYSNTIWYYTYDANGNNTSAMLDYDPSSGKHTNEAKYIFNYAYDDLDHLATMQYPTGTQLNYNTDPMGNVLNIAPYVTAINYFPDGKVQSFTDANGVSTTYTENDRTMIDSLAVAAGSTQLENRKYTYDGDNNILSIQDALNAANNQSFGYNSVNWLTSGSGPWGKASITYDVNGNILTKNTGNEELIYNYDSQTNLLNLVTGTSHYKFSYDTLGDVAIMGDSIYTYDALKHLVTAKGTNATGQPFTINYSYDGNGNRVFANNSLTGANTLEAYSRGSQLLYKFDGTQHDLYIYLGEHTIAHTTIKASNANTTYLHDNLLGSPLNATDATGTSLWQQEYQPYGTELNDNPAIESSHIGFTGKPHDKDTGLSYYGARYYNPQLGRFMSPDSRQMVDTMPITFNKYDYANNNPYTYKDPDGNFVEAVIGLVLGAYSGYETGGIAGAAVGGFAGFIVGIVDPFASEAVGAYASALAGAAVGVVARFGTSVTINTAANIGISESTTGTPNWGLSFSMALGGAAVGGVTTSGMSILGNYAGKEWGNAVASGAMAQHGSNMAASTYNSLAGSSNNMASAASNSATGAGCIGISFPNMGETEKDAEASMSCGLGTPAPSTDSPDGTAGGADEGGGHGGDGDGGDDGGDTGGGDDGGGDDH